MLLRQEVGGEYLVGALTAALVFSKEIGPRSLISVASLCTSILLHRTFAGVLLLGRFVSK